MDAPLPHHQLSTSAASGGAPGGRSSFSVATFNVHAGVDGWGRPFDVVGRCLDLDADVLVLEETWTPDAGPGIAAQVADALGYAVVEQPLASGRRAGPDPDADDRWMRSMDWRGASHAIFLDSELPFSQRIRSSARYRDAELGRWGVAVLTRLPIERDWRIELGRLARDRARRVAIVAELSLGNEATVTSTPGAPPARDGGPGASGAAAPHVTVIGTHMSHITYGAPLHFLRLRRRLETTVGQGPAVLLGDMNLWGPPVAAFLPGWHRALRENTWPAWRPHSHVDHVLVRGGLEVLDATVLPTAGSDHLPVRVRLGVGTQDRS